VREALEVYALRETAKLGLKRQDFAPLERVLETYAGLVRDNVMRQRLQVDREFHVTLAALPGNRALSQMLESVYERIFLKIRTEGFRTTGAEGYQEHVQLLRSLKRGDFGAAESMLTAHITQGRDRLLDHIAESAWDEGAVVPLRTLPETRQ
jgi:DNA-binding GntR family transcriptional regulator